MMTDNGLGSMVTVSKAKSDKIKMMLMLTLYKLSRLKIKNMMKIKPRSKKNRQLLIA